MPVGLINCGRLFRSELATGKEKWTKIAICKISDKNNKTSSCAEHSESYTRAWKCQTVSHDAVASDASFIIQCQIYTQACVHSSLSNFPPSQLCVALLEMHVIIDQFALRLRNIRHKAGIHTGPVNALSWSVVMVDLGNMSMRWKNTTWIGCCQVTSVTWL